jgi:hypothetical protein
MVGLMLGSLVAGCGESRRDVPVPDVPVPEGAAPVVARQADAVLRVDYHASELTAVWMGEASSQPLGVTNGHELLSPDRRHVFMDRSDPVVVSMDGTEVPISLRTGIPYSTAPTTSVLAWSPDGERLAWIDEQGVPTVGDGDARHPRAVSTEAQGDYGLIAWAPDGSRVAFGIGASVVLADRDATNAGTIETGFEPFSGDSADVPAPMWSPDSTSLALTAIQQDLLLIDGRGAVTRFDLDAGTPAVGWSFDGSWFALSTIDEELLAFAADGTVKRAWNGLRPDAKWSPVDERLLFAADGKLMTWTPSDEVTLELGEAGGSVAWSPDASIVATQVGVRHDGRPAGYAFFDSFSAERTATADAQSIEWNAAGTRLWLRSNELSLLLADPRGEGQTAITGYAARVVTWLPDGEHLAVAAPDRVITLAADGSESVTVLNLIRDTGVSWLAPEPE